MVGEEVVPRLGLEPDQLIKSQLLYQLSYRGNQEGQKIENDRDFVNTTLLGFRGTGVLSQCNLPSSKSASV